MFDALIICYYMNFPAPKYLVLNSNQHMNMFQFKDRFLFCYYSDHIPVQVRMCMIIIIVKLILFIIIFIRFFVRWVRKLKLCMSHRCSIRTVDRIGKKHGATVLLWKVQLLRTLLNKEL